MVKDVLGILETQAVIIAVVALAVLSLASSAAAGSVVAGGAVSMFATVVSALVFYRLTRGLRHASWVAIAVGELAKVAIVVVGLAGVFQAPGIVPAAALWGFVLAFLAYFWSLRRT